MMTAEDTIAAPATGSQPAALGIIRVSGPRAIEIADSVWKGARLQDTPAGTVRLGMLLAADGSPVDQVVATVFRAPHSFTGEDTVELSHHGSRWIRRVLLQRLCEAGARMAEPGEFSRRAFLNGKMDLAQAEGVADLIASSSRASQRMAMNQMRGGFSRSLENLRSQLIELASLLELELDFSEEDVEFADRSRMRSLAEKLHTSIARLHRSFSTGQAIKEGIPIAIVGPTNAGKSSLLNLMLGDRRAIVSDIHGTTRDTIEETMELGDYLFRFIDTAGLRLTDDPIEKIGIERSQEALGKASLVLLITDPTAPTSGVTADGLPQAASGLPQAAAEMLQKADRDGKLIPIINKTDVAREEDIEAMRLALSRTYSSQPAEISAKQGDGLDELEQRIINYADAAFDESSTTEGIVVTNRRHAEALRHADSNLQRLLEGMDAGLPADLLAQDLREAIHHLGTVTGAITTPDILHTIFSRFCIGK